MIYGTASFSLSNKGSNNKGYIFWNLSTIKHIHFIFFSSFQPRLVFSVSPRNRKIVELGIANKVEPRLSIWSSRIRYGNGILTFFSLLNHSQLFFNQLITCANPQNIKAAGKVLSFDLCLVYSSLPKIIERFS